jgi:hypothetical protein
MMFLNLSPLSRYWHILSSMDSWIEAWAWVDKCVTRPRGQLEFDLTVRHPNCADICGGSRSVKWYHQETMKATPYSFFG